MDAQSVHEERYLIERVLPSQLMEELLELVGVHTFLITLDYLHSLGAGDACNYCQSLFGKMSDVDLEWLVWPAVFVGRDDCPGDAHLVEEDDAIPLLF